MNLKIKTVVLVFLLVNASNLLAQNGTAYSQVNTNFIQAKSAEITGNIKGSVIDSKTGEALIGATVLIEGTQIAVFTDIEGKFSMNKVQLGVYNLSISHIKYEKKVISGVDVKPKEVTSVNILLEEKTKQLNNVVIKAELKKETAAALLLTQKKNVSISDGVSADMIKKTPDATTSDVMKRVSGTSIQDNKFAIIRGLNDRYNTAYINGAPLPSTESDRKAFSFDIFPSNMLDNMVITKTASPDLPGDFAGGLITINTKDIPDKRFISLSNGLSTHSITTGKAGLLQEGGKTDWLGIDDGTRALPNGIPDRLAYEQADNATKYNSSLKFNDNWKTEKIASLPLNSSFQLSGGNSYKLSKKNSFGFILSASYNNSNRNSYVERNRFNKPISVPDNQLLSSFTDSIYKNEILIGLMANAGFKIGSNNKFSFKNAVTINTENEIINRGGFADFLDQSSNPIVRNTYFIYQENRLYTSQLIGNHYLPKINLKINWILNNNIIKRDMPDFKRFSTRATITDVNTGEYSPFAAQIGPGVDITQTGRFYSSLDESIKSAGVDFQKPIKSFLDGKIKTEIKTGAFTQSRTRDFQARVFGYKLKQVNNPTNAYNYQKYIQTPLDQIFSKSKLAQDTLYIDERINPQDVYGASSKLNAFYLMLDQRFFARFRLAYGVRAEQYNQQLQSKGATGEAVNVNTTITDWLPSANFTFEMTNKINLRLSGSRTVARPEFRELAPFSFYDFNLNSVVAGNPNIKRTSIQNYDFRFEYYPGESQLISASLFYKKFDNAIESVYEFIGSDATLGYTSDANAKNYGVELELRKNLDLLDKAFSTKWIKKFSITCNYAYIFSEVTLDKQIALSQFGTRPLQGQSPYIVNASFQFYDPKTRVSAALFVNQVGRRIAYAREKNGLVPDLWENPRTVIDFSISSPIYKGLEAKFSIGDLLAQDLIFYQDNNNNGKYDEVSNAKMLDPTILPSEKSTFDNTVFKHKKGYTISFGLSYKF